ncbi:exodeoxyribonuclease V subunit beta [Thermodesulfobacteriota bacterium]
MKEANPFDILSSPLEGTNLIEASAGTGKTYTITCLYLRLVLEERLPPDKILAVTFTEAATLELKDRIRKRLNEAIRAFSEGASIDKFLEDLVKKIKDPAHAVALIKNVLQDFDEAAVYTIHGFCRRVLYENAFESGSLFDTELLSDEQDIIQEIVEDFWRTNFYGGSPLFVSYVMEKGLSPDSLMALLSGKSSTPYLKVIPEPKAADSSKLEAALKGFFERLRESWAGSRVEVREILNDESLSRVSYKKNKIQEWISAMDRFAGSGGKNLQLFPGFEKFTTSEIYRAVKKDKNPPQHPFFDLCQELLTQKEELIDIYENNLLGIKASMFQYIRGELEKRKRERNVQSFNDLLIKVKMALEEKGGEVLAQAVREKYKAVLIDEFQDTDPVQYSIFKKIFGNNPPPFFLIGDPKQAIYGFRGADVFTYMEAARNISLKHTLLENWRSEPGLVHAVNAVFTASENPFVYEEIKFYPGTAVERKEKKLLLINNRHEPPFKLWFLDAERFKGPDKAIGKGDARRHIRKAVASEISWLVALGREKKAYLGDRPLREGDIAVLVRTNVEGRLMQEALSAYNIPSVLFSTGNLFSSHEAMEIERVLTGISEPNNESLVLAALCTDIMGLKGEAIETLMEDETDWDNLMGRMRSYHSLWNSRSFIRMFREFLDRENVLPRLMSLPDGERRNTNLLHLSEVLHRASTEKKLAVSGLLKWLSEKRSLADEKIEEYQLRLETDENAVQIATIHKSKGLEYPVVFCPFAWDGSRILKKDEPFTYHDASGGMRLTLDLGSERMHENRSLAQKEELSENLRLLYVALTRAQSRCYMVWGRINGTETSAQAYLFHEKKLYSNGEIFEGTHYFNEMADDELKADLKELTERASGEIVLNPLPQKEGVQSHKSGLKKEKLFFREFPGVINDEWGINSFSSLTSGTADTFEPADRDAMSVEEDIPVLSEPKSEKDIFSFPKGARAGTFFHDLLEHLDFTGREGPGLEEVTLEKLKVYGFEPHWTETVCEAVERLLRTPLSNEDNDLVFSKIGSASRLNELEFYFPLKRITPAALRRVFGKSSGGETGVEFTGIIDNLIFKPAEGFMKGFIDLVFEWQKKFYIVDWKSNFLGNRPEDYGKDSILGAMKSHQYVLQYHIYALALDQYLRLRIPEYRYEDFFGGAFYVFLRGIDPEMGPDYGIYRDLPSPELMRTLRSALIETPGQV